MKTTKLILGIISIVVFIVIMFQSCAAGLYTSFNGDTADTSSGGGIVLSFLILIGGIVGIATKNSKGGGIVAGIFYLFAGVMGFANAGVFSDLEIWSWMAVIFGVVFLLGSIFMKKPAKPDHSA